MSATDMEEVKDQVVADCTPMDLADGDNAAEDLKPSNENLENPMPSVQKQEETIKKKYGGILPRKQPLISKDHERAYFDSADWALGKQGAKPKGPLEALRPKLQPSAHQQARSRRSSYSRPGSTEDAGNDSTSSDEQLDGGSSNSTAVEDQNHHE